jgi:ketosteroid isomerase-like protein
LVVASTVLTTALVQAEVARFWDALASKSTQAIEDFYSQDSTVFGTSSPRPEPGRLSTIRRAREYFHPQTTLHAQLGAIEVHLLGETAAVAVYTFQFHASRAKIGIERTSEEHVVSGRATQVFHFDAEGKLRILHEHLSVVHRI